jgi:hypothetical protein
VDRVGIVDPRRVRFESVIERGIRREHPRSGSKYKRQDFPAIFFDSGCAAARGRDGGWLGSNAIPSMSHRPTLRMPTRSKRPAVEAADRTINSHRALDATPPPPTTTIFRKDESGANARLSLGKMDTNVTSQRHFVS